ncbi:MAG: hypothetical protein JSV00_05305 [bacterium]|nr:MAG: hypothetical protein JSV00_05305 [bacterium]
MEPVRIVALLTGIFFLSFGLAAYRHFYKVLGAAAGLAIWAAFNDTAVQLPGLREHPGTASLLLMLLMVLSGVLVASKFRRVLAFLGGLGTGIILSQSLSSFFAGGPLLSGSIPEGAPGSMDILAGLVAGVLFIVLERFLAVLLTSAVGSFLCAWALGGRWTFAVCLALGLVAQPLIFSRLGRGRKAGGGEGTGGGSTTALLLLVLLLPATASADWTLRRVNAATSRVVIDAGWRDGVRKGERFAVTDQKGTLLAVITVSDVFTDSSYSEPLDAAKIPLLAMGMPVIPMEEHEYLRAMKGGGESELAAFLEKYPRSRRREEVAQALDAQRFRQAEMENSIDAFQRFQRQYPTSGFAGQARRREQELSFRRAREESSEASFRQFLDRYPDSGLVSGMVEVRNYLRAVEIGKVYAYRDFVSAFPESLLAEDFVTRIREFELWVDRLEFGDDPVAAMGYFASAGDETAVPHLVGKLMVPGLEAEAKKTIFSIGQPALDVLLEVLISPLQSIALKDKVALIIGEMGDITAIPAVRSYVGAEKTAAGRKALLMLEDKAGR